MTDTAPNIHAVIVNHSTSVFTELAIRSFYIAHPGDTRVRFTVMDNASQDDTTGLEQYLASRDIPFQQSGHDSATQQANSHGEVLQRFVQSHPDCDDYLLLDADICFVRPGTVDSMLAELRSAPAAWAIQARSTRTTRAIFEHQRQLITQAQRDADWDDRARTLYQHSLARPPLGPPPEGILEPPRPLPGPLTDDARDQPIVTTVRTLRPRCEPCCTLVANTPVFRRVNEHIGFSGASIAADDPKAAGVYDTMGLMTAAMNTHEHHYLVSSCGVLHMWMVAYNRAAPALNVKHEQGAALLDRYRNDDVPDFSHDDWMTPEYLTWVIQRDGYQPVSSR
jgi:hypothetical protein